MSIATKMRLNAALGAMAAAYMIGVDYAPRMTAVLATIVPTFPIP